MIEDMRERLARPRVLPPVLPRPRLALKDGFADSPPLLRVDGTFVSLAEETNSAAMKHIQLFRPYDPWGDHACYPGLALRRVARLCTQEGHSSCEHCRDLRKLVINPFGDVSFNLLAAQRYTSTWLSVSAMPTS